MEAMRDWTKAPTWRLVDVADRTDMDLSLIFSGIDAHYAAVESIKKLKHCHSSITSVDG
jgi:hypothetical protein